MSKIEFLKQDIDIVESLPSLYPAMQEFEEQAVINVVKALREKESSEPTDMDKLTIEMMEHICDNLCKHPCNIKDVEKLEDICAECKMGKFVCDILNTYNRLNDFDKTQSYDLLKKLSEYRSLEEQGLLLRLPCKSGTEYFRIEPYFWMDREKCENCQYFHEGDDLFRDDPCCTYEEKHDVEPVQCLSVDKGYFRNVEHIVQNLNEFGKTVFLTEQEAQSALEKMKEE